MTSRTIRRESRRANSEKTPEDQVDLALDETIVAVCRMDAFGAVIAERYDGNCCRQKVA